MNDNNAPVNIFSPQTGVLCEFAATPFPSAMSGWNRSPLELAANNSHYGYVAQGRAELETPNGRFLLSEGMYFCIPGEGAVRGLEGHGIVATRLGYRGLFQLGGPIESTGRLRYIDGCSDTLLIAPPLQGDPCLNLLKIPPHTHQTSHTHPTVRFGVIARGHGTCKTPAGDFALAPGLMFSIAPDAEHSFHTEDDSLLVIAWHPDSDCGPTHNDHPMINRTMIAGVSAAQLEEYRT